MKQSMKLLTSSQTNEWYTPPIYIEAVREVLGGIDLDPASCAAANEWIQAETYYTELDDGLSKIWRGRTFINPPFGKTGVKSNQEIWANRLWHHHMMKEVSAGILLTKCVPGYKWWDKLFHNLGIPVCFIKDRIEFIRLGEDGEVVKVGKAKAGSNFWYFGNFDAGEDKFREVFSRFGRVV